MNLRYLKPTTRTDDVRLNVSKFVITIKLYLVFKFYR